MRAEILGKNWNSILAFRPDRMRFDTQHHQKPRRRAEELLKRHRAIVIASLAVRSILINKALVEVGSKDPKRIAKTVARPHATPTEATRGDQV